MTHRIWSLDTQRFLVVKMSDNNPPEITFTGTGNEDGTGDKGFCKLQLVILVYSFFSCFACSLATYFVNLPRFAIRDGKT